MAIELKKPLGLPSCGKVMIQHFSILPVVLSSAVNDRLTCAIAMPTSRLAGPLNVNGRSHASSTYQDSCHRLQLP
jgi:hypothetical protein